MSLLFTIIFAIILAPFVFALIVMVFGGIYIIIGKVLSAICHSFKMLTGGL